MEVVFLVVVLTLAISLATFFVLLNRRGASEALESEMDNDFVEEFELDDSGQPSERGMEDLVQWMEEDLQMRRIEESEEIESVEELPENQSGLS